MTQCEALLKEHFGYDLPSAPAPAAAYVPYVISGSLIFISGQLPRLGDLSVEGAISDSDEDIAKGQHAAQICAVNILAQCKAALATQGLSLDHVSKVVRLGGFVNTAAGMSKQPLVINGASELMNNVFENGRGAHARAAVSASALPFNVSVEIEAVIEFSSQPCC